MQRFSCVFVFLLVLITEIKATVNDNNDELSWSTVMGNARNTLRLMPSLTTEFNGSTWTSIFNSSSQDTTIFGTAAGINGDLYFFVTDSRYSSGSILLVFHSKFYFIEI
jgi:hypothetical protein